MELVEKNSEISYFDVEKGVERTEIA